jgi:hypothetical protein
MHRNFGKHWRIISKGLDQKQTKLILHVIETRVAVKWDPANTITKFGLEPEVTKAWGRRYFGCSLSVKQTHYMNYPAMKNGVKRLKLEYKRTEQP